MFVCFGFVESESFSGSLITEVSLRLQLSALSTSHIHTRMKKYIY